MKYALLIYGDETGWDTATDAERDDLYREYQDFAREHLERGMMLGGEELRTSESATTVRIREGLPLVTDGPFAETKEQLGGFFLVECEDLDEAIEVASRVPGARTGAIEVRPIVERPERPR